MKKIILALGLIALLAMVPFPVSAQNEQLPPDPTLSGDFTQQFMGERIIVDTFLLRPLGLAATLIGIGSSIPAAPMAVPSNSTDRVGRELIERPFDYTFKRPLGDVDF